MNNKHTTIISDHLLKASNFDLYYRYPDISHRKSWEGLSEELKREVVRSGEEAQKEPWTQLLISDFREFSRSGNRIRFEDKYFPRRRKLNRLVMAECIENKGRFLDDILDGLYLILEETTWCLPPHNSYERDAKQEPMPDALRPIIDLFDAESGAEVAFTEYLLRPVLKEVSPFVSKYVNERLRERIFDPYQNQHFWWMGNGKESMCNWTPWCTQNVLLSVLTREKGFFTQEQIKEFLFKAAKSCDYFLDDYGEDGGCSEGAQYYSHAGLCLFGCLELIDGATGSLPGSYAEVDETGNVIVHDETENGFCNVYKEKIIRNIANYIVKMNVAGDYYVNFADCSAIAGHRTCREYLFGKATKDEALSGFVAADFKRQSVEERLIPGEINLFYHCMQVFAYDEMLEYPDKTVLPEDSWYESIGLMVARDGVFTLAAKAGNNDDSHNHNDVGSFTIYKNGKPYAIDLGVGTYTKKTFSDRRYEIWTMQSQFHNLPTFIAADKDLQSLGNDPEKDLYDGSVHMEKAGREYAADNVSVMLGASDPDKKEGICSTLSMDIAPAFGCSLIKSYNRKISLKNSQGVLVEDEYQGSLNAVMTVMTYEEPRLSSMDKEQRCCEITVGDLGRITAKGVSDVYIRRYEINDERLKNAWKHDVYRILFKVDEADKKFEIFFG